MISSNNNDLRPHAASTTPTSGNRFEDATHPRATTPSATTSVVARRVNDALAVLLEAYEYAADLGVDVWDFAVELRELKKLQLTNGDLRWLVLKGYVEQACETTLAGEERRSFRTVRGLTFTKRTCFVITPAGLDAAAALGSRESVAPPAMPSVAAAPTPKVVPHWDADLQELRINGLIVKQFKVPAPNQEMVLAAFEEERWPARIDDPLPPQVDQDPKRRLHDTIVSLNRSHKHRLIRFMGDGSGEGIRWTTVTDEVAPVGDDHASDRD
jgi:hypothetical protein